MIADVLTYKGFVGWSCGDTYESLQWNEIEAGRAKPTESEIDAWEEQWVLAVQIAVIDKQLADIDFSMYRNRGTREQDIITAPFVANQVYGMTEPQLYASSKEYKRVKDAELITAAGLRADRKVLDDQLDILKAQNP